MQEVQKQLFHSQTETNQRLNDFAQKIVTQNDTQDKLAGQLSSLLEEIQSMQSTLKNVQVDQDRQQKQQDNYGRNIRNGNVMQMKLKCKFLITWTLTLRYHLLLVKKISSLFLIN